MAKQFGYGSRFGGRFNGRFGDHGENSEKKQSFIKEEEWGALISEEEAKDHPITLPSIKVGGSGAVWGLHPGRFIVESQGQSIKALVEKTLVSGRKISVNIPLNGVPVRKNGEYAVDCTANYVFTVLSKTDHIEITKEDLLSEDHLRVQTATQTFVRAVPTREYADNGVSEVVTDNKVVLDIASASKKAK